MSYLCTADFHQNSNIEALTGSAYLGVGFIDSIDAPT